MKAIKFSSHFSRNYKQHIARNEQLVNVEGITFLSWRGSFKLVCSYGLTCMSPVQTHL